ncbi:MAG: hypothetical protein PVI57_20930 [Gemmatimonadota bacterium]|jgi:hypothetical protein
MVLSHPSLDHVLLPLEEPGLLQLVEDGIEGPRADVARSWLRLLATLRGAKPKRGLPICVPITGALEAVCGAGHIVQELRGGGR